MIGEIRVYISGPYSGDDEQRRANITIAEAAAWRVAEMDACTPLVPHSYGRYLHDLWSWERAMASCLAMLDACCVVLMLPGWELSRGAQCERDHASANGIPVVYSHGELETFVREAAR